MDLGIILSDTTLHVLDNLWEPGSVSILDILHCAIRFSESSFVLFLPLM